MGFRVLKSIRKNEFKLNIKRLQVFIRAEYLPIQRNSINVHFVLCRKIFEFDLKVRDFSRE